MITNYLKIAWRNLWRNKSFSLINVVGLTGGTVCCLYILLYVKEQYDFDKHHQGAENIFRITTDVISSDKTEKMAIISMPIPLAIGADFPEVETTTRVVNRTDVNEHLFRSGDKSFYVTKGYYVDSTFFKVFTYKFIEGTPLQCLDQPLSMVISSDIAKKLFGNERAIHKTINMTNRFGTNDYLITGVFDESYSHSHVRPNFVINIYSGRLGGFLRNNQSWAGTNDVALGYVKLKQNTDAKTFEAKLTPYVAEKGATELAAKGQKKVMHLQPIKDIHVSSKLKSELDTNSNATFLFILILIAVFIQLIACINFMNLSTAQSVRRAKEIGVRKAIGAGKTALIRQFLGESLLIAAISAALALVVLHILLPYFNLLSSYQLTIDIFKNGFLWLLILGLIGITGLLAGSYPAFYLSSFEAFDVLKGNFRHRLSSVGLRKGLVVFQFMISIGLIISVLVMRNQVKYMQGKDLGFNQEQKLVIPIRSRQAILNIVTYKNEVAKIAEVHKVSGVGHYLGFKIKEEVPLYKNGETTADAKPILYNQTDENYFEMMSIPLVAGRNFTPADTLNKVILNETAAKTLGLSVNEASGQRLYTGRGANPEPFDVVGVVKDFNFHSLHEPIKPLFIRYNTLFPYLIVSSRSSDYANLITKLQAAWQQFNPQEPFEYSFVDENIQKLYESENTLLGIINAFTLLAIIICCLGLFGLAAFTAEQRVKEIGIRKVLGASVGSIAVLLSKDFLKLVLLSVLIISPIAYYFMNQWLQDFAYRINISWWVFALAGVMALLIALLTVSFQAIKAAVANPVKSLRTE